MSNEIKSFRQTVWIEFVLKYICILQAPAITPKYKYTFVVYVQPLHTWCRTVTASFPL